MSIYAYSGIDHNELDTVRLTSEGRKYSLNHPDSLIVNMKFKGSGMSGANSQGWERNSSSYFRAVQSQHPEFFSKKNTARIQNNEAPRVDATFVSFFPQYKGYERQILVHHHIGKNGQAVALPQSIHKGSGEIHTVENELGITSNAEVYSKYCQYACELQPSLLGRTADEISKGEVISMDEHHELEQGYTKKREITTSIWKGRVEATEEVLDNYRENLRAHGVTDEAAMEKFISRERTKIYDEYDRLDQGDTARPYQTPMDWEKTAQAVKADEKSHDSGITGNDENSNDGQSAETPRSNNAFTRASIRNTREGEEQSNAFQRAAANNAEGSRSSTENAFQRAARINAESNSVAKGSTQAEATHTSTHSIEGGRSK